MANPAIELKLACALVDHDVRHRHWLRDRIGEGLLDAGVVTTGPYTRLRPNAVAVVPTALLGA